ncbi:hypothetical protein [Microbacterium sp.]|uniref:hypothetical protein n=1 Tax=Microbacterium sp. TaxID=51671 RepID=UPI0039E38AE7
MTDYDAAWDTLRIDLPRIRSAIESILVELVSADDQPTIQAVADAAASPSSGAMP